MAQINEAKNNTLATLGYTGSVDDAYHNYLVAESGQTSLSTQDLEKYLFSELGYTGAVYDMWFEFLRDNGFTNSLQDMLHAFWNSDSAGLSPLYFSELYAPLTHSLVLERGTGSPTFTRADATNCATFRDWEGVLKTVPSGCARFEGARMVRNYITGSSENLANAAWAKTAAGDTVTGGITDVPSGKAQSTRITPDGTTTFHGVNQTITIATGNTLIASTSMKDDGCTYGYMLIGGANKEAVFNLATGAVSNVSAGVTADIESEGEGWYRCYLIRTVGAAEGNIYTGPTTSATTGNSAAAAANKILMTGVQWEDITGRTDQTTPSEYVSVGVLSAPYHGAGVDGVKYFNTDLTGAAIPAATNTGYLAEAPATNLCLQSQSFDTTWTATALTTISSTRTAPDGTATAFEFDDGVSGGTSHRRFQSPVNTTAVPHTMSVYAKDVDRGWIGFRLTDSGGVNRLCWFNIAAGVVGTAEAGFTTSIQSLPNGWYRCIATLTTFAGDSTPLLFLAPSDGVDVYVGSNKKAQLWGAQVELGSSASTYIPTTTAAVTREADVLTYPSAGNISDAAGWCSVEMKLLKSPSGSVGTIGSSGSSAAIYNNAGQPEIYRLFDGTGGAAVAGATSLNASVKTASTWGGVTSQLAVNGTAGSVGTFDGSLNFGANIYIGSLAGGAGSELNGTIRNVRIGQRQLSASEMQAITS